MLTLYIAFKIAQLGLIFAFICPAPFLWVYDRVHGELALRRIRRQIGMSRMKLCDFAAAAEYFEDEAK